jgi:2-keto-4-pentenoate hydratase/2-oxohepta-3-ene-1,7-dioic acid hydratase in catechol pathway
MGHPLTSLTWLVNWLSSRGITLKAGEIVSTGTCTGHCFASQETKCGPSLMPSARSPCFTRDQLAAHFAVTKTYGHGNGNS